MIVFSFASALVSEGNKALIKGNNEIKETNLMNQRDNQEDNHQIAIEDLHVQHSEEVIGGTSAISGATVFSDSTIVTAKGSSAVVSLGKLGRVQ